MIHELTYDMDCLVHSPSCRRCVKCGEWVNAQNADGPCPPPPKACAACGLPISRSESYCTYTSREGVYHMNCW